MNKPTNLQTKIFLDGGVPQETREIKELLGFLDGQTTNPTLITKNPAFTACKSKAEGCSQEEMWEMYKQIVTEISPLVSDGSSNTQNTESEFSSGSVSIEVYADQNTTADEMIAKGSEIFTWIPNAHVKLPTTKAGLEAARELTNKGVKVNMTLCFTQEQAAAVYAATTGAKKGDVFISPFIGRLDDLDQNGMSLIQNIIKMYEFSDGHVEVLVASVRSMDHFLASLQLQADIITAPAKILKEWGNQDLIVPGEDYKYNSQGLSDIPYQEFDLTKDWQKFDISHELTDKGIKKFADDWNVLS